ncbi:MAG: YceI family protein [Flavobacteriales bacterium]
MMIRQTILALAIVALVGNTLNAQKYFTKSGSIRFFSTTKVEDIEATSSTATCVVDATTGDVQWSVLVKDFHFEKALMEEHFNENYMESTKFPKADFKGKIENIATVNFKADGTYSVKVKGDLTMHGVTKNITTDATITVKAGAVSCSAKFNVNPDDYNIAIPATVQDKISKSIEVTVSATLAELKK